MDRLRTPILRFDPRARLLAGGILGMQVLLLPAWHRGQESILSWPRTPGYGLILAFVLLLVFVWMARPPLKRLGFGLAAVGWMLVLTIALHLFTTPGLILFQVPGTGIEATREGLSNGLLLAARLAGMVLVGITLSLSLSALEAVRSAEILLSPLARIGLPVGSAALLVGMSLRFVPTLYSESLQLKKALQARGWTPGRGLTSRVRAWLPLFIPLLAGSLRRADDLAETLVLRGHDPTRIRTHYALSRWNPRDSLLIAIVALPLAWTTLSLIFFRIFEG